MITLKIFDRKKQELNFGDIVKISDGKTFNFYAEVKYLEHERAIAPFHTFSFHSMEKVDKVPEGATESTETRYKIWYINEPDEDLEAKDFQDYLMGWRDCERLLEKSVFEITI